MKLVRTNESAVETRRSFLKKAVYAAPAVILLGSLQAHAANNGNSKLVGNAPSTPPGQTKPK